MKRAKLRQHKRRLPSGKVIIVNKGVRPKIRRKKHTTKINKDKEWGEYQVVLLDDGVPVKNADYFTTDKDDAYDTAREMVKHADKNKRSRRMSVLPDDLKKVNYEKFAEMVVNDEKTNYAFSELPDDLLDTIDEDEDRDEIEAQKAFARLDNIPYKDLSYDEQEFVDAERMAGMSMSEARKYLDKVEPMKKEPDRDYGSEAEIAMERKLDSYLRSKEN